MATFSIEIRMGNAAMQTNADVARVLRFIADSLEDGTSFVGGARASGILRDENGNDVGDWGYEP